MVIDESQDPTKPLLMIAALQERYPALKDQAVLLRVQAAWIALVPPGPDTMANQVLMVESATALMVLAQFCLDAKARFEGLTSGEQA